MVFEAYNHVTIPAFIYGTAWKREATARLVQTAVSLGFRAIDTANQLLHYHEALVGEALGSLEKEGFPREMLFVQTKFTPVFGQDDRIPYDPRADLSTQVAQSFARSLVHLRTDYVDSYLLHGPYAREGLSQSDWEVWRALEAIYREGRARMIGVSNVTAGQLRELCEQATIRPMVVQNRCYAARGWDQAVREICRQYGVIYQGFSLLTANREVLHDETVQALARRLQATPQQIVFRLALQLEILPLTGTTSERHMQEDLAVLNHFELSSDEVKRLETRFTL
ncbi:MAG: aldo/keto reductase [Nitrospirae bacterium]|nr:MAG: aldo/keto reductase [Nitrospirota bacterium]